MEYYHFHDYSAELIGVIKANEKIVVLLGEYRGRNEDGSFRIEQLREFEFLAQELRFFVEYLAYPTYKKRSNIAMQDEHLTVAQTKYLAYKIAKLKAEESDREQRNELYKIYLQSHEIETQKKPPVKRKKFGRRLREALEHEQLFIMVRLGTEPSADVHAIIGSAKPAVGFDWGWTDSYHYTVDGIEKAKPLKLDLTWD